MQHAANPLVTIVTPSYNQARFLEETIKSVVEQDYDNIEYIIMDGGSTDGSIDIIRNYEDHVSYWESTRDKGQSHAIVKGWERSKGEILGWLNSDDTLCEGSIRIIAEEFMRNKRTLLVEGACNVIDREGGLIASKPPQEMNPYRMLKMAGGVPGQPAVFIRRQVFKELGGLNCDLHYIMDWEYWIRIGLNYSRERFRKVQCPIANSRDWKMTKTNTGLTKIYDEHRHVLDDIYAGIDETGGNDPNLRKLRRIRKLAYSSTYIKQSVAVYGAGRYREALEYYKIGWKLYPFRVNPVYLMRLFSSMLMNDRGHVPR